MADGSCGNVITAPCADMRKSCFFHRTYHSCPKTTAGVHMMLKKLLHCDWTRFGNDFIKVIVSQMYNVLKLCPIPQVEELILLCAQHSQWRCVRFLLSIHYSHGFDLDWVRHPKRFEANELFRQCLYNVFRILALDQTNYHDIIRMIGSIPSHMFHMYPETVFVYLDTSAWLTIQHPWSRMWDHFCARMGTLWDGLYLNDAIQRLKKEAQTEERLSFSRLIFEQESACFPLRLQFVQVVTNFLIMNTCMLRDLVAVVTSYLFSKELPSC